MNSINPITPRTETVVVLQGDDDERVRLLAAEVERLERSKPRASSGPRLLGDLDPVEKWEADLAEARRAHDECLRQSEERGVKVVLRAVGRKTWRELIAKHPPREGDEFEMDKQYGANIDALQEDLVPMCMASPTGSKEEIAAFLDSLNEGQFGYLAIRAHALNMGRTADPTQRLSSKDSRTSAATSS